MSNELISKSDMRCSHSYSLFQSMTHMRKKNHTMNHKMLFRISYIAVHFILCMTDTFNLFSLKEEKRNVQNYKR